MEESKSHRDLRETAQLLFDHVWDCYHGKRYHYTGIAIQLRKLLCDVARGEDNSLLQRLYPDIKLHPLPEPPSDVIDCYLRRTADLPENRKLFFYGTGEFTNLFPGMYTLFEVEREPISLREWLDQLVMYVHVVDPAKGFITLRQLIRSVADKEGAHSDVRYDDVLEVTMAIKTQWLCHEEDSRVSYILLTGEYILEQLNKLIGTKYIKKNLSSQGTGVFVKQIILEGELVQPNILSEE